MRHGLCVATAAVAGALLTGSASADDFNRWSVFLGVGKTEWEESFPEIGITASDNTTSFTAGVGFRPARHLGFELAYYDVGTAEETVAGVTGRAKGDGIGVSALGLLPVSERWMLHGRVGMVSWDTEATLEAPGIVVSTENSGEDPIFGIGAAVHWEKGAFARLEYNYLEADNAELSSLTLSIVWTF